MLRNRIVWVLAVILLIVGLVLLGRRAATYIPTFAAWVESLGPWGPVAFIAGYIVAAVAFVPGSLLTMAGGALFGIVRGTLYVFIGASIGATAAFLVSRYVVRGAVLKRMADNKRFRAVDAAIAREGRKIVFLLRLSPAFPFNLMNYALGVTSVRLADYVVACIGMLPVTILWVYYGRLIGDVAKVVTGAPVVHGPSYWIVLALGLIATIIVTIVITRAARRALSTAMEDKAE